MKINVYTYYKTTTDLTGSALTSIILNKEYVVGTSDNRVNIPVSEKYCLAEDTIFSDDGCSKRPSLLWGIDELKKIENIRIYITGYNAASKTLDIDFVDFKDKSLAFIGIKNVQNIKVTISSSSKEITGNHKFNNINFKAFVPKDQKDTVIDFKNILIGKIIIVVEGDNH